MTDFVTHRDPEASLWQAAVDEAVARRQGGQLPTPAHPVSRAAALGGTLIGGLKAFRAAHPNLPIPEISAVLAVADDSPTHFGAVVADLARRFPNNQDAFLAALRHTKFGTLDPLWIEAATNYYVHLKSHREDVPYRTYQGLGDFVLPLPNPARVALLSDWGTGTPEAAAVLEQICARAPSVFIHLGDIYYAGLDSEVRQRFEQPLRAVLNLQKVAAYTLAGNHDMYSGGRPYYDLLDRLHQPASYFCLRNDDWQIIALDTGRNSGLTHRETTFLQETEVAWVRDKIQTAGNRKTILLSHHPLFSAFESIGPEGDGINHSFLEQMQPFLTPANRIARWFWGHEHALTVYQEFQNVTARCIGHGAIPVSAELNARPQEGLGMGTNEDIRLGTNGFFYNHGYVVLELDGPIGTARYYQHPGGPDALFAEAL